MANRSSHEKLLLLAIGLAVCLAPTPGLADGVEEPAPPSVSAAPPPLAPQANAPAPCEGNAPVGQVVAVSGAAHAQAPGQAPRSLACDDALRACEELVTEPGASLGFLSGDVLVRVGGGSRVSLGGSEGAPDLFVHQGSVRSTDGRPAGAAPVRLVTRDLAASATGADAELEAGAGAPSRLCAYDGSAAVEAGAASHTLAAGQCLAAEGGGVTRFAAAGAPALGLAGPGFCAYEVALDDSLTPGDVAAPPPDVFPGGDPAGDAPRDPCDKPGASCVGGGADRFDDPDPVPGCDAPGVDCDGKIPKEKVPKDEISKDKVPKDKGGFDKYPKFDKGGIDPFGGKPGKDDKPKS
jgi:hypothetical protein